jgi:hypothetical protein
VDLNYTQYCPLNEIYVGLYSTNDPDTGANEDTDGGIVRRKPPMWAEVERRMEDGGLDLLRNGTTKAQPKTSVAHPSTQRIKSKSVVAKAPASSNTLSTNTIRKENTQGQLRSNRRERRKNIISTKPEIIAPVIEKADDENISDGGFFEE